ncbi:MAG: 16S rRNA (adenine(1518)-N(6)/adenine(1519)-N(6))-dimethyltransferase RsmA [Bacteroidetes bacterium]|nr:MAG: 16S rRNA (adenine(1518)-N(6)/adenine(1519)-N(6))-dimethyltransferase RsmA [Bacteroidota bacterium]
MSLGAVRLFRFAPCDTARGEPESRLHAYLWDKSQGVKAKKSYGQHFLTNHHIARRIARSLQGSGPVLEVGPGKGMLTQYLLELGRPLKVVEADPDMVAWLETHFPDLGPHIIAADFLEVPLDEVFDGQAFSLVGNFPYNISSQIVFHMLDYRQHVPEMVGMFQLEMARRIVAGPGSKEYGVISVLTQAWYEGKLLFQVSKGNFNPPPKVQSAVIRLERKEDAALGCDEALFRTVVKTVFNQRRKMLRNTVKSLVPPGTSLEHELMTRRPEQLSLDEFVALTNWVAACQAGQST